MNSIELSIVVPVYNSGEIIHKLYACIVAALDKQYTFEILFVNDCSKDNSWQKIKELTAANPFVTGINLKKNSGQDNALLAGLRMAKGNYVVIMDDDLQHHPKDILLLYATVCKGFDVCYANFETKKQSKIKNAGSNLNGRMAEILIAKPKEIYLSPFKIINKSTVAEIIKFAGPYPYIDGIILSITSNITQVEITHHERNSGKGNYSIKRSANVFFKMFTGFSILPLRIATVTGILATLFGIVLAFKYVYDYFIAKNYVEGWTTVVILIIVFGGLILTSLGIIGEYIGRTYLAINNKPQYSISEIVKSKEN